MANIGITMGCPVGIGPELILKYFHANHFQQGKSPIVIGDINVLRHCSKQLNISHTLTEWIPGSIPIPDTIPVLSLSKLDPTTLTWGRPDKRTGAAMASYIEKAVELAQTKQLLGFATCPISKYALHQAGSPFPGHTEMLAHLTQTEEYAMMLAGKTLRVTLVTIHCSLAEVSNLLTVEKIFELIVTTHTALTNDFGIPKPRIAVAGLNPHSGEEGMFGREEINVITPAVLLAQEKGIDASGPFPPDTVFNHAANGEYDTVVCMYHDQGLIPFKLLHFKDGVNLTLGLPIVRTSVDHGTAYEIAGKGIADVSSLTEAINLAWTISKNRNKLQS